MAQQMFVSLIDSAVAWFVVRRDYSATGEEHGALH